MRDPSAAANRRAFHDHKSGAPQILDEALGDDLCHEFIGAVDALAGMKVQWESEGRRSPSDRRALAFCTTILAIRITGGSGKDFGSLTGGASSATSADLFLLP